MLLLHKCKNEIGDLMKTLLAFLVLVRRKSEKNMSKNWGMTLMYMSILIQDMSFCY